MFTPSRMLPDNVSSLPSRGAWIEMVCLSHPQLDCTVAPLAGSVDRNCVVAKKEGQGSVAPLAGSVDRNTDAYETAVAYVVAPLAGSVDRNLKPAVADHARQ